jgi:hypothetical protein
MAKKTNSPKGGKRGCLCEDGTYSSECCKGELINQGIGTLETQQTSNVQHTINERVISTSNG